VTGARVWVPWPNKNNVGFRQLLQQVVTHHKHTPVKVVIVLDNFRIHKAKAVLAWLHTIAPSCASISCQPIRPASIRLNGFGGTSGAA